MAEELIALAPQFSQRMGGGVPVTVCAEPMDPGEEGFSGAKLLRLRCTYADGGEATCIAKHTTWQERAVMQTFTGQGRGFTPAAWDTQETSREDAWLLLEDVSPSQPLPRWPPSTGITCSAPAPRPCFPPPKRTIGSGSPQPFPWTTSSASASRMGRSPGATAAFCPSCTSGGSALSGKCWPSARRKPPSP